MLRTIATAVLFFFILTGPANAAYKVIWFWLDNDKQHGAAYQDGVKVHEFDILSGSDDLVQYPGTNRWTLKPTPKGVFKIQQMHRRYTNQHGVKMPYAMFFTRSCAIHGFAENMDLPPLEVQVELASKGCISLNWADIVWLFNWADIGTTVVIEGYRFNN